MNLSKIFLVLLIGFFVIGCAETEPKEVKIFNEKMEKTIAIHDEVMPDMAKINQLMGKLEAKMDSTTIGQYEPAVEDLKMGHDKMMSWMKNFGDEFSRAEINQGIKLTDKDSLNARLDALNESYNEAEDMRNHIQNAIKKAEELLK